jgi:hypothetical protein
MDNKTLLVAVIGTAMLSIVLAGCGTNTTSKALIIANNSTAQAVQATQSIVPIAETTQPGMIPPRMQTPRYDGHRSILIDLPF